MPTFQTHTSEVPIEVSHDRQISIYYTYSELGWTEIAWIRLVLNKTVAVFLLESSIRCPNSIAPWHVILSGKVKEVIFTSPRRSIRPQFKLWCNCPHVSRTSHDVNEICNYKLYKECSLMSESYWRLLATLWHKAARTCLEDWIPQFCWKYASYNFKINVMKLFY
jgi:hypothetical protein